MTELEASLAAPLPRRLRVGKGNALFLEGSCLAGGEAIRALEVVANDARYPVIAHGMPAPESRAASGDRWCALLPVARGGEGPLRVGLRARLANGTEVSANLGDVELAPPSPEPTGSPPETGGGSLVAIAMATHQPPLELLERQIASIRDQAHESWICVISDDASDAGHVDAMREILADDPRFRLHRSPDRRGVSRNFERALELVPAEVEYVALATRTIGGTRTSS